MISLTVDEALVLVDVILAPKRLNTLQELVFRHCWAGRTYKEIAQISGYDGDYIRIIGSRLWQSLSEATGHKITKNNLHVVLRQYSSTGSVKARETGSGLEEASKTARTGPAPLPDFPGGPCPPTCPYYVEFSAIEADCDQELSKPGALIRIKAPEKRGKSSLMLRLLSWAESQGYQVVRLNLQQVEGTILQNLDRFLRWFCANVAQQLKLESKLDHLWDVDLGSKISCTVYMQGQVLSCLNQPLVIALDEIHRLFEYPEIARDFLPLLRLWHEEANNLDEWAKLRMIVVYSTENYIPLELNQSPFNVGLPVRLPKFSLDQTQSLAYQYGLMALNDFRDQDLVMLHEMVDGHPYLLNLALYHYSRGTVSMQKLMHHAPTPTGIYGEHLRSLLTMLQRAPTLSAAFQSVLKADTAVELDVIVAYQLERIGLVSLNGHLARPSCNLYRLYFRDHLIGH